MKTNEIIEGNKLIAEFIGMQQGRIKDKRWPSDWFDDKGIINGHRNEILLFHSSWDWLMPVVERIEEQTEWGLVMYPDMCYWNSFGNKPIGLDEDFCGSRIKCVYEAVIEFIKWYNKQSK